MAGMSTNVAVEVGTPERIGRIISDILVALLVAFFAYGYLAYFLS